MEVWLSPLLLNFRVFHALIILSHYIGTNQPTIHRSGVIIEVGLLLGLHLADSLYVVLVGQELAVSTQCVHACFDANCLKLSTVEVVSGASCISLENTKLDEVNLLVVHPPGMDFKNLGTCVLSRHWELDLPVQST